MSQVFIVAASLEIPRARACQRKSFAIRRDRIPTVIPLGRLTITWSGLFPFLGDLLVVSKDAPFEYAPVRFVSGPS